MWISLDYEFWAPHCPRWGNLMLCHQNVASSAVYHSQMGTCENPSSHGAQTSVTLRANALCRHSPWTTLPQDGTPHLLLLVRKYACTYVGGSFASNWRKDRTDFPMTHMDLGSMFPTAKYPRSSPHARHCHTHAVFSPKCVFLICALIPKSQSPNATMAKSHWELTASGHGDTTTKETQSPRAEALRPGELAVRCCHRTYPVTLEPPSHLFPPGLPRQALRTGFLWHPSIHPFQLHPFQPLQWASA